MSKPILLVCYGPLGRLLNSFCAAARVRTALPDTHIVLLTSPSMAGLASGAPWFDEILTAEPASPDVKLSTLAKSISRTKYACIIDLERSRQTAAFFAAFGFFPPRFASHAPKAKWRASDTGEHPVEADQLLLDKAGIAPVAADLSLGPDLGWLLKKAGGSPSLKPAYFGLEKPFVLLNLASTDHGQKPDQGQNQDPDQELDQEAGPLNDWPDQAFSDLAEIILGSNTMVAITGSMQARERAKPLLRAFPKIRDLCARADPFQLAALGREARGIVGLADGVMHLCAAGGGRCISLHGSKAEAKCSSVRSPNAISLYAEPLSALKAEDVLKTMRMFGAL